MNLMLPHVTAGAFLLAALPCAAGVLRVPEDYPSVLVAIDASTAGDSVVVGPGVWTAKETRIVSIGGSLKTFTSCGFLKGGVTIVGSGKDVTTLDAGVSGTGFVTPLLFANHPGTEATVESLSITGAASAGSGVFADNAGRLVLRACGVSGITSSGHSGAVEVQNCDLLLEDCEASFNVSGGAAGVYAVDCSIEILRCRFEGNQGRAVELSGTGNNDSAVILDCEFIDNRMSVDGAAVGLVDPYTVQVERNLFLRNVNTSDTGGGLWVTYSFGTIRYNTFAYDSTYGNGGAAGLLFGFFNGDVSNNTFVGCHAPATTTGSAVVGMGSAGIFNFSNNLFVNCTGAAAIGIFAPLPGSCNGFWNNEGGVGDYIPSATDVFLDPRFCDAPSLDFTLDAQSPYAAGNNTTCGQVGAFGVGCGSVAVRAMTWGQLKTLYR